VKKLTEYGIMIKVIFNKHKSKKINNNSKKNKNTYVLLRKIYIFGQL